MEAPEPVSGDDVQDTGRGKKTDFQLEKLENNPKRDLPEEKTYMSGDRGIETSP